MYNKVIIPLFLLLILSISCCSNKRIKETSLIKNKTNSNEIIQKKMLDDGFIEATIIVTKNTSPCDFLIQLNNEGNTLLEPTQKLADSLRQNNKQIWIKYQQLRRMSRCSNSQPIKILAIENR